MDVHEQIVAFKRRWRRNRDALRRAFGEVKDHVSRAVDGILAGRRCRTRR